MPAQVLNPQKALELVEIEYVPEKVELDGDVDDEFKKVLESFNFLETPATDSDSEDELEQDTQQKKEKQGVSRPDVVEAWDATASDPKLHIFLKSYRNTVAVPRHWCQKRKFLQGKRGFQKQPFQLPDFIAATGIEKIRQAGKMDIDYQVLHDAFFKHQTKPKLTSHGDLYYEGKEFEVKPRELTRIPPGAKFGYGHGDWGKPPVDEEEEEEEKEEDEVPEAEVEDGIQSVDSLSSTPTGGETPDVIDLRKQQRKEPDRPLYQVLEEKEEKIAPGTLLGTSHTYVINTGAKRVDLLRGEKADRVDITLAPEEMDALEKVLPDKYEEAREEEKLRTQREDFSDMVAENEKKKKRKMHDKENKSKKDFKF